LRENKKAEEPGGGQLAQEVVAAARPEAVSARPHARHLLRRRRPQGAAEVKDFESGKKTSKANLGSIFRTFLSAENHGNEVK
jgi:hypothetical protein